MTQGTGGLPVEPRAIDQPWRLWAAAIVLFIIAFGTLCGLVLIPVVQGRAVGVDAWTAICRAVGIAPGSPAALQPASAAPPHPATDVAWTPAIVARLIGNDPGGGAASAETCAPCHGQQGISTGPEFPDLAGQSAFAIYKQLHDYRNGARANRVMAAIVQGLNNE